ncbi:transposase, MuDR, MULE transposase domain protein [Tanacetum coccineum]
MKNDKLQAIYWKTCKAYTPEEFQRRVSDLRGFRPEAYKKLEVAGFEIWSRAMCLADRYSFISLNDNLFDIDSDANTLSDWATHKVMDRMKKSAHWKVLEIDYGRLYQVDDRRRVHQVDLTFRTCTCRKWQLSGIPCGHVIAVSKKMGCTDCSHLALGWFRKTTLYSTCQDLVYPVGEPSSWVRPDGLQVVKPPNMNFHTAEYEAAYTNNYVRSQEYEAAYTNNYVRSQEYEAAYTNNYVSTQEYEAVYNNIDGGSQGYRSTYNNMNGSSQWYEAAYTNFNNMFEQANINFGGQLQHPLLTMPFTFSQFNLGQSSQQTYSTWDCSWDPINLSDP